MGSSAGTIASAPPHGVARSGQRVRAGERTATPVWPEPLALALLAGLLNFWDLARNGWANTYYSGAVRSMSASWHNFLFASFDPSGVMSVDKPPLALWIETASVKLFGFHSIAILAPQALMGVASVLLVYDLTRRRFGRAAGFVAGLVLALTPIGVAISRHNNPDALLILCSVAAVWCALRALEGGRTRWLVLAGVCVGLGFETKMLIALAVVPGIAAAWIWVSPNRLRPAATAADAPDDAAGPVAIADSSFARAARGGPRALPGRLRTVRQLLAGGAALLLVGGAWPLLVELTPAADRPWVSGTANDTIRSLIFGYNGLGRIEGQGGGPQALGGSNLFGGSAGPLRLLNEALGGQAGWLLGFALVSAVAILLACRLRRADPRCGWLLVVGGAFLTTAVVFSFAEGIFHPYYVSLLAPFSAALVGAGFAQLLRGGLRMRVLAALAIAAGVATELAVLHDYPTELRWLTPTLLVLGALAAALALVGAPRLRRAALAGALALLLLAPATWAVQTLGHATSGTFPAGGPAGNPASGLGGGPGGGPSGARGFPGAPPGGSAGGRPGPGGLAGAPPGAVAQGGPPGAVAQGAPPGAVAQGGPPGAVAQSGPPGAVPQGAPASGRPAPFGNGAGSTRAPSQEAAGAVVAGGPEAAAASAGGARGEARSGGRVGRPGSGSGSFAPGITGHNGAGAGGPGGGTSQSLTAAVRYAAAHGGGTIAVSSQSEAAPLVIAGDRVAGIGGFSGRESETSAAWLAREVRAGRIRWVLTTGGAGPGGAGAPGLQTGVGFGRAGGPAAGAPGGRDLRVGATRALAAVAASCRRVSGVSGLYDCAGRAARLAGT
jgi:4-amino-4-deoxy-L-arabinose transferase-like glycosyltransferase